MRRCCSALLLWLAYPAGAAAADRWQEPADVREMLVNGYWPAALDRLKVQIAACEAARPAADECLHLLWLATKAALGTGDERQALSFGERALAVAERALPADDPDVSNSHTYLAGVFDNLARYADAEAHYRKALAIREAQRPRDAMQLSDAYDGLAANLDRQGRPEMAEPFLILALQARESMPATPDRNMALAFSYRDLGARFMNQYRFVEAEKFQRRAYDLMLPLVGKGPHTAPYLRALAVNLTAQGRMDEAELIAREALAATEQAVVETSPLIAHSALILAMVVDTRGDAGEAEGLLRRALDIYGRKYPEGHPDLATTLVRLSSNLSRQGRFAEAEEGLRVAYRMRLTYFAPDTYPVIAGGEALARQLLHKGADAEARTLLARAGRGALARMSAYPGFTQAARVEMADYRGVFHAQVVAAWRLSGASTP